MRTILLMAIWFFGCSLFATNHKSPHNSIPNLSIEVNDSQQFQVPLRSERVQAFEHWGSNKEVNAQDELSQDLIYSRNLRAGLNPFKINPPPKQSHWVPPLPFQKNKKTIVFFDVNFAPAEIKAAQEAARDRGENLLIYPERTEAQHKEIDQTYRRLIAATEESVRCEKETSRDCTKLVVEINELRERLQRAVGSIKRLDNIEEIFSQLEAQEISPSIFIFSGHSGGDGNFGGVFGYLNTEGIALALTTHPRLGSALTSIMLWGCYSGTLASLVNVWQKQLLPNLGYIGYRNRAPLGIRVSSGRLLKSYLLKESEFLKTSEIKKAHPIFKNLDLVASLDATAVVKENFFSYDRAAKVSELLEICDRFDAKLMEQYECYAHGKRGCENPPSNHLGPLRQFYSYLQVNRHCENILRSKFPNLPGPESVVRLIYVDTIKGNFNRHHKNEFASFNELLSELSLPLSYGIENYINSSRANDVQRKKQTHEELNSLGLRDGSYLIKENWSAVLKMNSTLRRLNWVLGFDNYVPATPCIPFSWVEPGATEKDSCLFEQYLVKPLPPLAEAQLLNGYYFDRFFFESRFIFPNVFYFGNHTGNTLASTKLSYLSFLESEINILESDSSRTELQTNWLQLFKQRQEEALNLEPRPIVELLLVDLEKVMLKLEELIHAAEIENNGTLAATNLAMFKNRFKEKKEELMGYLVKIENGEVGTAVELFDNGIVKIDVDGYSGYTYKSATELGYRVNCSYPKRRRVCRR